MGSKLDIYYQPPVYISWGRMQMGSRLDIYNQPLVCTLRWKLQQKQDKQLGSVSCEHFNITVMAGTEGLNPFGVKDQKVTYSPYSLGEDKGDTGHAQRRSLESKREDTTPQQVMPSPSSPTGLWAGIHLGWKTFIRSGRILGQGRRGKQSKILTKSKQRRTALEELPWKNCPAQMS